MLARRLAMLLMALLGVTEVQAGVVFVEQLDAPGGIFSRDPNNPTPIPALEVGANFVSGIIEDVFGPPRDNDFYTITIQPDTQLDSIYLFNYVSTDEFAFVAVDIGPTFPFPNLSVVSDLSQFIGGTLIGPDVKYLPDPAPPNTYRNLLDVIGSGANGTQIGTFSTLGPGVYTFYAQQTADQTEYTLQFNVSATAVPEPSSALLLIPALAFSVNTRRRRK